MKRTIAGAAVAVATIIAAPCAAARSYDVYGCRLPNGAATGTAGWEPSGTSQGVTNNGCAQGGFLFAGLADREVGDYEAAGWRFVAPVDTQIAGFRLVRAVRVGGHRNYHLWQQFTPRDVFPPARTDAEYCMTWMGFCNAIGTLGFGTAIEASALPGTRVLDTLVNCGGGEEADVHHGVARPFPDSGVVQIISSRIGLADIVPPTFAQPPAGTLLEPRSSISGTQVVRFAATDRGGGLQTMGLLVDGEPRAVQPIDAGNASCRAPYVALVPCPLSSQPTLAVDTREIANGTHSVRVIVTDVAGNQTQSDPVQVTIRNGGQPNGANATGAAKLEAWFKSNRAHRTHATVAYGAATTIEGRLTTADSKPIGAAILEATGQVTRPGSEPAALGTVATDAHGRFAIPVPRGSSRELRLGYRAHTFDEQEAASATLTLNVRAGVRLDVSPKRVRNGTKATFSGRILGGPGQFGTQVTIYALTAKRPIPVETVPADQRGRFRYRYRFSSISGRGGFRFQAVVKSQPTYPYALGRSKAVNVRARP